RFDGFMRTAVTLFAVAVMFAAFTYKANAQGDDAATRADQRPSAELPGTLDGQSPQTGTSTGGLAVLVGNLVDARPRWLLLLPAALLLAVGVGIGNLVRGPAEAQSISKLGPSFFFWLGMGYTGLLLLVGGSYLMAYPGNEPYLLGGVLPIAVPWFGALGAV